MRLRLATGAEWFGPGRSDGFQSFRCPLSDRPGRTFGRLFGGPKRGDTVGETGSIGGEPRLVLSVIRRSPLTTWETLPVQGVDGLYPEYRF